MSDCHARKGCRSGLPRRIVSLPGLVWIDWRGDRSVSVGRVITFDPAKRSTRLSVTSSRMFSDGSQSLYLPRKLTGTTSDTTMSFWPVRSEEHTSELQSLMRYSYAVFCFKKKKDN